MRQDHADEPESHDHGHHHGHGHVHGTLQGRRLTITLVLVGVYMVAEVIGGLLSNSLALLADAGHMLSDAAALGLSLFAIHLARRPSTPQRSYGYYRAEILAALANGAALVALSIYIFVEAIQRFLAPAEVQGGLMLWIAAGGLAVNVVSLWILHAGRQESLNVHGAWLHVLGDALGSVGTIVAGLLIWAFGWYWSDPLASLLIGGLIIYSSWALLKEAVAVLMESAPRGIDPDNVLAAILAVPGVRAAHDLHIWTITSGIHALSAHVTVESQVDDHETLGAIRHVLHERFHIDHLTIQVEPEGFEDRGKRLTT